MFSGVMATPIRIAVLVVWALAALLMAAALVVWLLVKTDWARERLEVGLGEALGMDVQIGQPPQLSLLRGVNVTLSDLEVSTEEQVVATAESVNVRLAPFSLLTGTVLPLELYIERPELSIERYSPGVFNIEKMMPPHNTSAGRGEAVSADRRPDVDRPTPANKLTPAERDEILAVANSEVYRSLPPS